MFRKAVPIVEGRGFSAHTRLKSCLGRRSQACREKRAERSIVPGVIGLAMTMERVRPEEPNALRLGTMHFLQYAASGHPNRREPNAQIHRAMA